MDLNSTEFETDFSSAKKRLKNDQNDLSQSIELNEKRNFKEDPSDDDGNLTCFVEWCNTMGIFIDLNKVNQTMNTANLAFLFRDRPRSFESRHRPVPKRS